jgi:hypothetical protein
MPIIPKFDKPGGPCSRPCGHNQCAVLIQIAGTPCAKCGRKIGYGREYVQIEGGALQHVECPVK